MTEVGSFLKVWEKDSVYCIEPADKHAIDAAVEKYLETGRDSLLYLTLYCGDEYVTRVSCIMNWRESTPAGRQRQRELDAAGKEEDGIPAWEEAE